MLSVDQKFLAVKGQKSKKKRQYFLLYDASKLQYIV